MANNLFSLVSDIRNIAASGKDNYSFRIEDAQIAYFVHQARSKFIVEALNRRESITDLWVQSIDCMNLIQVDKSDCCQVPTGCYILKSVLPIPNTIENTNDNFILRVTKPNGDIIPKSNPFKSKYNSYNKYTRKINFWYLQDSYLYIINEELLSNCNIFGLFEDPEDLNNYVSCNGLPCFDWSSPYPVSLKMANDITNYILRSKVLPFLQFPQDTTNNASNDINTNSKNQITPQP